MPETLLLTSIRDDLTGTARLEARPEALHLRVNLTLSAPLPSSDVIKLYLLSSAERKAEPYRAGLVEMSGTSGQFEALYRKTTVFSPETYDSLAVIQKNVFTEEFFLKAAAFSGEHWDVGTPFGDPHPELEPFQEPQPTPTEKAEPPFPTPVQSEPETEISDSDTVPQTEPADADQLSEIHRLLDELHRNEAYRAFLTLSEEIQDPVERAIDALEAIKELRKTKSKEQDIHLWYRERLHQKLQDFQTVQLPADTGFTWHRIDYPTPLAALSSFQHVLFHPQVLQAISRHRHYLLGERQEQAQYCLAIPVAANEPNPLMHMDDCCVFLHSNTPGLDYSTVCIALEADGQYFLPLGEEPKKSEI